MLPSVTIHVSYLAVCRVLDEDVAVKGCAVVHLQYRGKTENGIFCSLLSRVVILNPQIGNCQ